jgi:hypothetical protein
MLIESLLDVLDFSVFTLCFMTRAGARLAGSARNVDRDEAPTFGCVDRVRSTAKDLDL